MTLDERWTWAARVTQRMALHDDGVALEIEIAGDGPFPAGVGWHPWFRRDIPDRGDVRVLVDADKQYELAFDLIPNGRLAAVEGERDLRRYAEVGNRRLDDCYRAVRQPMRIAWGDVELTMTSSANVGHTVVYTPEHAVCIEPQTCAIDAFNLDARGVEAGTVVVERDRPLVASTEWRWRISGEPDPASDPASRADS
jgi:aldose 1-epimerase